MAFEVETTSEKYPWIEPPAHRIGVDVMRLSLPDRFTFHAFVETVGDAVRTFQFRSIHRLLSIPSAFPLRFRDAVPLPPRFPESLGVHVTIGF